MQVPASLRRRALLHRFGIAIFVAFVAFWARLSRRVLAANEVPNPTRDNTDAEPLAKWGMAIDLDRCTGCGGCVVACRVENNIPNLGPDPNLRGADIYWMNLLPTDRPTEGAPELPIDDAALPVPCMHCENPPCVKVCPVGATQLSSEGIVGQISDRCIGCRFCEVACPYGVRFFNWTEPEWNGSLLNTLNPDVSTRPRGVVEKCTFCHHRVRRVREEARIEERSVTDEEVRHLPACAEACPAEAITFGNLNDPTSRVTRLSESSRAVHLLDHLGTQPKVSYLRRRNYR